MLVFNEVPDDLLPYEENEIKRLRDRLENNTYRQGNHLRWESNDSVVPLDTFERAYAEIPEEQEWARDKQTEETLRNYRENHSGYSDQQKAEMRAAFGAGTTVQNVITGETIEL